MAGTIPPDAAWRTAGQQVYATTLHCPRRNFPRRPPYLYNQWQSTCQVARNSTVAIAVLANDTDAKGDALTISALSAPANGTARIKANGAVWEP